MSTDDALEEAIDVLQQLGLREYEARCFVGLSRLPSGTAKQISEVTDVPRTRVYDATRVLAAQGLVEVQHSSPQQFRAVPLEEATAILRDQYEDRVDRLTDSLQAVERVESDTEEPIQQVWALTGTEAIATRTQRLLADGEEEIVFVVGDDALLTDELIKRLQSLPDEVELLVGAVSTTLRDRVRREVPGATAYVSGLGWLEDDAATTGPSVGRLLLVDRSTILVSSITPDTGEEHAIYGGGFGNGLVVIARRLMAQGLVNRIEASDD